MIASEFISRHRWSRLPLFQGSCLLIFPAEASSTAGKLRKPKPQSETFSWSGLRTAADGVPALIGGAADADAQQQIGPQRLVGGLDGQHMIVRLDGGVEIPLYDRL